MNVFYPGNNSRLSAENVRVAATLAQIDINSDPDILEDYELILEFSDTQVSRQRLSIYGTNGLEWGDLGHLSMKHLRKLRYFFQILVTTNSVHRGRHSPHRCVCQTIARLHQCLKVPVPNYPCCLNCVISNMEICSGSYLTNWYEKVHTYVQWCECGVNFSVNLHYSRQRGHVCCL